MRGPKSGQHRNRGQNSRTYVGGGIIIGSRLEICKYLFSFEIAAAFRCALCLCVLAGRFVSSGPDHHIATWRANHPTWQFRLWGNADLDGCRWRARRQIEIFREGGYWEGVADLMRYEILHEQGGVYVDADSISVRPLGNWIMAQRMFAVWESEKHRPGLIANTFIGSVPEHPALGAIIQATSRMNKKVWSRSAMARYRLTVNV